jgi:hypothetical protein
MKNKQTKEATKVRVDKKNEQDYQYQQLFRELVIEHFDKDDLCDNCMKLKFCGTEDHPTPNFLVGTLNTLGYPTPRQVSELGLVPYNTYEFQNVRSSIDLKKWDPKQVKRILINRNARPIYPISPLQEFFVDED